MHCEGMRERKRDEGDEEDVRSTDLALLLRSEEQRKVDLKDRLEQPHVGTLVQSDLVLPDVDDQDFRDGDREQGGFALKVLQRQLGQYSSGEEGEGDEPGPRHVLVHPSPLRP